MFPLGLQCHILVLIESTVILAVSFLNLFFALGVAYQVPFKSGII